MDVESLQACSLIGSNSCSYTQFVELRHSRHKSFTDWPSAVAIVYHTVLIT